MKKRLSRHFCIGLFLSAVFVALASLPAAITSAWADRLTVTVLYDNVPFDRALQTHWGFSCLLEKGSSRVLFDAGAQPETLIANVKTLRINLASLDAIVFSHIHADHTAGYPGLKEEVVTDPPIYCLQSFPAEFKQQLKAIEVSSPMVLPDRDFRTTGELLGQPANEQALIVRTERGLVVVTGCAHPGIVEIVRRVKEISGERIHLIMGGFHLLEATPTQVTEIAGELHSLGVQRIAPSHCTGEAAMEIFKKEYGADFVSSGAGRILQIHGAPTSD